MGDLFAREGEVELCHLFSDTLQRTRGMFSFGGALSRPQHRRVSYQRPHWQAIPFHKTTYSMPNSGCRRRLSIGQTASPSTRWPSYGSTRRSPTRTGRPTTKPGSYQNLPPAVIIDLDETAIDNSAYEAGLVVNDTRFNSKTWDDWTKAEQANAVPGAVEFANYAATKGVKVFYVSNRNADQKEATRHNLEALGFPMGATSTLCLCKRTGRNGLRAP